MAASGNIVGELRTVDSEGHLNAESLSVHFDKHMLNFVVLEGESVTQLDGHRVGMVQLVDKPFELINAWFLCPYPGEFTGQRKWYKEFRTFATFCRLKIPQMSLIDSIDETCNGG